MTSAHQRLPILLMNINHELGKTSRAEDEEEKGQKGLYGGPNGQH